MANNGSAHEHKGCAYPGCRFPEMPLTRICHACKVLPAHHLCQIAFEAEHNLVDKDGNPIDCSTPYCPDCYAEKQGISLHPYLGDENVGGEDEGGVPVLVIDSSDDEDEEHQGSAEARPSQPLATQPYKAVPPRPTQNYERLQPPAGQAPAPPAPAAVRSERATNSTLRAGDGAAKPKPAGEEAPASTWYADCPKEPDLYAALSMDACREECQEWARSAGFNLVCKKSEKDGRGTFFKATFVCKCKGREKTGGSDPALDPTNRRARQTERALPGDELCPFQ